MQASLLQVDIYPVSTYMLGFCHTWSVHSVLLHSALGAKIITQEGK